MEYFSVSSLEYGAVASPRNLTFLFHHGVCYKMPDFTDIMEKNVPVFVTRSNTPRRSTELKTDCKAVTFNHS